MRSLPGGIRIIEPDREMAIKCLEKARALVSERIADHDWMLMTKYYAAYVALLAVLARIGIRCESDARSIACMRAIGRFSDEERSSMERACKARQDGCCTGRLADTFLRVPEFIETCDVIVRTLDEEEIGEIRSRIFPAR